MNVCMPIHEIPYQDTAENGYRFLFIPMLYVCLVKAAESEALNNGFKLQWAMALLSYRCQIS